MPLDSADLYRAMYSSGVRGAYHLGFDQRNRSGNGSGSGSVPHGVGGYLHDVRRSTSSYSWPLSLTSLLCCLLQRETGGYHR